MKIVDNIAICLMVGAYIGIIGVVWVIDKVRRLFGKQSLLEKWTNTW